MERLQLRADFSVPRIIKGNWQIADDHSGCVESDAGLFEHMAAFVDAGITAFDCGDIYYGVEARIGEFIEWFRRERGANAAHTIAVHTKYVPAFLQAAELRAHGERDVRAIIDRSLQRLKIDRLHLVQLHWWNYGIPGNVETALALQQLQREGKLQHVGGTNYNVPELRRMVEAGVDMIANQVQYSLLDRRPRNGMAQYCQDNGIGLFCYGSIAGGLLSRKWLGVADPGRPAFENVSLDKYYRIIRDFGGWDLFQELLKVLDAIANKHGVDIPVIASRWVLDQPGVTAVIQGARHARHLRNNLRIFETRLDDADRASLEAVLVRSRGPNGDCYDLDRIENRDAEENVATEYFDVEAGKLVKRSRPPISVAEPYGHHIKPEG